MTDDTTPAETDPTPATPKREKKPREPKAQTPPPAPPPAPVETARDPKGKLGTIVALMRRQEGATVPQMMEATGWQAHSVRGAMAGALKKKLNLEIASTKTEGAERTYRIAEATGDQS